MLNQCRSLARIRDQTTSQGVKKSFLVSPHQLTARLSAGPKYFGKANRELKIRDEAFERFET